jgi:hypothetical protein
MKMVNNVAMTSVFIDNMDEPFCVGCAHGKNCWQVFPKHVQDDKVKKTRQVYHVEVVGPMHIQSLGDNQYYVSFEDNHSTYRMLDCFK